MNTMTTKEQILVEARKVFEKYGYNKTSLGDIAQAAQKGRRTVYTYFESKEDIFKAVIEIEIEALVSSMQQFISSDLQADKKLRQYMHLRMDAVKQLTLYFDAIRRDLIDNLSVIERIRKQYDTMEVALIGKILDQGVSEKVFDIGDTQMVASAIVLAIKGFELPLIFGQPSFDHQKLIDPLISLFYKGIHVNKSDK